MTRLLLVLSLASAMGFLASCKNQYLTGTFTRAQFVQQTKWKKPVAEKYEPDPIYLDSLKTLKDSVDVKLFLGTWCSDSRKWVPRFFQIQRHLPIRKLEIIGVDTTKKDAGGLWKTYDVDSVPSFLFFRNGKLIGRLNVKPPKPGRNLEKALWRAIRYGEAVGNPSKKKKKTATKTGTPRF